GIRDPLVTGVQTCALPILGGGHRSDARQRPLGERHPGASGLPKPRSATGWITSEATGGPPTFGAWASARCGGGLHPVSRNTRVRSEERRVGKDGHEGRARG